MLDRLSGEKGARLRVEAFASQKIVAGDKALAKALSENAELVEFKAGTVAVEQDGADNDVYFVLTGLFSILVSGKEVQRRGPGDTFGEMAAIEPSLLRSATV